MQPYAEGQALASAVVAMAIFFVFAAWSGANLMKTKCKLYEVLLVSALVRTASYAIHVANLVHPRNVFYVTAESLENVGYGISVAVLYLAIFQFLRTSEHPRLPHAKALSALPIALVVPTAAFSVVLAPLGYAYLYERNDAGSNAAGTKILYASYWGRVCVLGTWFDFLSVVTLHALWSYNSSRAPVKAGEKRLLSDTPAGSVRSAMQHRSASVLDGRLLVPVIWICLVLEALSLAIQTASLYHPYLLQDKYTYPLSILPQFLEILVLNLPGVLWRLSFGPQRKEEPGSL